MARKQQSSERRALRSDSGNCWEVTKFTNLIMVSGKKAKAEAIISTVLRTINPSKKKATKIFLQAVENAKPIVEVRSKRVGGANYRVPVEVKPIRRTMLALRWLKDAANRRPERSAAGSLTKEILDASNRKGLAIKKRDEMSRLAESNRAFSHFRF